MAARHVLSSIDTVTRTAKCCLCGPTRIHGRERFRCAGMVMAQRRGNLVLCKHCGLTKPKRSDDVCVSCFPKHEGAEAARRYRRDSLLKARFGINAAQYEDILRQQRGLCAVCCRPPGRRRLAVDHDHGTGAIRGLLCDNCNRAIGMLQEDPALIRQAARYVEGMRQALVLPAAAHGRRIGRAHAP